MYNYDNFEAMIFVTIAYFYFLKMEGAVLREKTIKENLILTLSILTFEINFKSNK